jgi:hypothetical protein
MVFADKRPLGEATDWALTARAAPQKQIIEISLFIFIDKQLFGYKGTIFLL